MAIGAARQTFNGSDASIATKAIVTKLSYATWQLADKLPTQIHKTPSYCEPLMPRIIVLALLFCVGVPAIVGAAPIRIAYKGRFVDLERRFEPSAPFYCDVHGEFVIDETLPAQQMVVSASMVVDEKGLSLLAPADWRSISIRNDVSGDFYGYADKNYDKIYINALFAGWGGVMYEDRVDSGIEVEDPSISSTLTEFDRGYGIGFLLIGPSTSFDPITGIRSLTTFDRIQGQIDYRNWKRGDEQTWSMFEVTSIDVVPEPAAIKLLSTSIVLGVSFLSWNAKTRKARP